MKVTMGPYPKRSIKRKISVRIDKYDTWNMDSTLAHVVVPMLKQLKKAKPKPLGDHTKIAGAKYYETIKGPKHTYVADCAGIERYRERMQRGFVLFGKYYMALWD